MSVTIRPMGPFSYEGAAPWANYHNVGAAPIVRVIAGDCDVWWQAGAIPALAVPDAIRRVMRALNTGAGHTRRCTEVLGVLKWAKTHGVGVQWE